MLPRYQQRPDGSNWGDFGPDDQLGHLNLITEEQVLKGAREIRAGKTFCLSLPLDLPGGNVPTPGSLFCNPALAEAYSRIVREAARERYRFSDLVWGIVESTQFRMKGGA